MAALLATLAAHTWLSIAVMLASFLLLYAVLQASARAGAGRPETTRKLFHTGSGILTLAFPFVFHEVWPVLLLTGASAGFIAAIKFLPALRARVGHVANRVGRSTLGEVYFPVSVALLFWFAHDEDPLLFVVPILVLTFADATCALVGSRYGLTPYVGGSKSLEGSLAFVVVAFFCVHLPLLLWSGVGRAESLLIAATLALLVMVLEGSAWRGLDNLFIPIGGYFLLRAYLAMDVTALASRLMVAIALVTLVVIARHRTTLKDDSLAAAAFLCYVTWAVMGWRWLVPPFAILLGYRWLSEPTEDNSRPMHDVPAVLSIWTPAMACVVLAHALDRRDLLFPYTIAFGAHLASFGLSRLAFQFPTRPVGPLFTRAVIVSWLVVGVPFLATTGLTLLNGVTIATGIFAVAVGPAIFFRTEPDIRCASLGARRWVRQALAASVASACAWTLAAAAARVME